MSGASHLCRTKQGTGCPYCSGKTAIPGETDVATLFPELITEWHPTRNGDLSPSSIRPGSNKRVWWQCHEGHEWATAVVNRIEGGSGCPYCAGQRPIVGENDLGITHPVLASQLHPSKNGKLSAEDLMGGTPKGVVAMP